MAGRIYHGPRVVLLRDRTHYRRVEDPPLPEHPPRGEHFGGGTQKPDGAPFLGGRHKERFVVRQIEPHRRIAAQDPRHLPGLGDGWPEDAPPVGPLQWKILEYEESKLVTGLVESSFRHVSVDPYGVHSGLTHQGSVRAQTFLCRPSRVGIGGQVVDPAQENTLAVEIDVPIPQLHGTRTKTRPLYRPGTTQNHLVKRLLAPVP